MESTPPAKTCKLLANTNGELAGQRLCLLPNYFGAGLMCVAVTVQPVILKLFPALCVVVFIVSLVCTSDLILISVLVLLAKTLRTVLVIT